MFKDYSHEINREIRSISGYYELEKEITLELDGKEILCAVGTAVVDAACCGRWGCRYAIVIGSVVEWKYRRDKDGVPVSQVEPVTDEDTRRGLTERLQKAEHVTQVQFWA
jgi:hypothetical protein